MSVVFALSGFYILGVLSGAMGILYYGMYRLRKIDEARLKFTQEYTKTAREKMTSIKDRLDAAFAICERQFEILSGLEGPQSGPLHGKHKQQMSAELKRLEEEKMTLLKSVLADGIDPKLTTVNTSGEKETIKLSDFIARHDSAEAKNAPPAMVEPPKSKLTLVKNSKEQQ